VLLADDYPDLLIAFKRLLAPSCEVVGCVADGTALYETMATLQPDVIVVDLFIPPSNGLEICRHIKQVAPETPVIIFSAFIDAESTPRRSIRLCCQDVGSRGLVAGHS